MNGVKQGGCLSPMIFTLYMDVLIQKLKLSGIGCHIGRTYCVVFGYADDLILHQTVDLFLSKAYN